MAEMDYSRNSPFSATQAAYLAKPANLGKILNLGTSIAAAVGASNTSKAYPARVQANLEVLTGQKIWATIAAGVSGDTTSQMLVRLPDLLNQHNPQYTTIEVSVNDTRTDRSFTTAQTTANVQAMVDMCLANGSIPVLIGSAPFDPIWWNSVYDFNSVSKAIASNASVQAVAATQKLLYVDLFPLLNGRVGVISDGLHPNDAGHDIWGKAIAEAIRLNANTFTQTTVFSDSFNRADSTTGLGSAEVGGTWTQTVANSWGISGNKAYVAANTQYSLALLDSGKTNISIKGVCGATNSPIGFVARCTDTNNYYLGEISAARVVTIWKRVAGTFTQLNQAAALPSWVAGDTITFTIDNTHLNVAINGKIVAAATDSSISTGTLAGLWNSAGVNPTADSIIATV